MANPFASSPSRPKVQFTFQQSPAKPASASPSSTATGGIFGGHLSGPAMALPGRGLANDAKTNSINAPNKAETTTWTTRAPSQAQPSGPLPTSTPKNFTFSGNNPSTTPSNRPSTNPSTNPFTGLVSSSSSQPIPGSISSSTNPITGSVSSTLAPPQSQPPKSVSPGGTPHQAAPLFKTEPTPSFFGPSSTCTPPNKQTINRVQPSAIPSSGTSMNGDIDHQNAIREHFNLLGGGSVVNDAANEVTSAPLFTGPTLRDEHAKLKRSGRPTENFSQYGLLGGVLDEASEGFMMGDFVTNKDPRIFQNVAAPMSAFICGSQGSGKSHTLSCMLENCILASPASHLPRPLTGLVFHYDSFVGDSGGSPCEAAFLSSNAGVKVKVLCAPTNVGQIKRIYSALPNVTVEEFRINQADLNTKRMMDLMAFNPHGSKGTPLYLHVINRILRDLRIEQQRTNQPFNYDTFKSLVYAEDLTDGQSAPLKQRLDTLESFMVAAQAQAYSNRKKGIKTPKNVANVGNDWKPKAGQLTIMDMSCPCVTAEMACSLFNIALSLFLEQQSRNIGRVVALDEAHKYMVDSMESQTLTESLMATIRLQRHLGARIIIATQEPTISPKLLDLCSVTIVHRFTSPDWLLVLKQHLAGVSSRSAVDTNVKSELVEEQTGEETEKSVGVRPLLFGTQDITQQVFSRIIALRTGEALVFSPTAIVGMSEEKPLQVEVPELVTVKEEGQGGSKEPKPDTSVAGANLPDTLAALTPVSEVPPDLAPASAARAGAKNTPPESPDSKIASLFGLRSDDQQRPVLGNVPPGTSSASFAPTLMNEQPFSSVAMQNISFQNEFQHWSSDELHLVDHIGGPKPDHYQPGQTAAGRLSSAIGNLVKENKTPVRLGRGVLKVRIRGRVTSDGGRSVFAT